MSVPTYIHTYMQAHVHADARLYTCMCIFYTYIHTYIHTLHTDRQTDGRTDGRTDRQTYTSSDTYADVESHALPGSPAHYAMSKPASKMPSEQNLSKYFLKAKLQIHDVVAVVSHCRLISIRLVVCHVAQPQHRLASLERRQRGDLAHGVLVAEGHLCSVAQKINCCLRFGRLFKS